MVLASNPHTIELYSPFNDYLYAEADGTVTPGDAIEYDGQQTAGAKTEDLAVRVSTDLAPGQQFIVALEHSSAGRGIDDDYSDGDDLRYKVARRGDRYYMWHNTAEDISVFDPLVLHDDGSLRALNTAGGDVAADVVAVARSAVSNSTGTAKTRMKIEVI